MSAVRSPSLHLQYRAPAVPVQLVMAESYLCWSLRHSLLLLVLATVCCLAAENPLPLRTDISSPSKFASFKATLSSYIQELNSQELRIAYSAYLTVVRLPYLPFQQEKADIFKASLKWLLQHNSRRNPTYAVGLNLFTHLSTTERASYLGYRSPSAAYTTASQSSSVLLSGAAEPGTAASPDDAISAVIDIQAALGVTDSSGHQLQQHSISWMAALPSVWQQGACAAGWAFASVAMAEAASYKNTGRICSLSTRQVASCSKSATGCKGGSIEDALQYMVTAGLTTSSYLPYSASPSACPRVDLISASKLASYTALPPNSESALLAALDTGPIAAAISVDEAFFMYAGGVYMSDTCGSIPPNHAVVVVGAGYDAELKLPYFKIRNSWGEAWGEAGYMRILRTGKQNSRGMCNIATSAFQAVSADQLSRVPLEQVIPKCKNRTMTVTSTTSLASVAQKYNTTLARIQIDNGLTDTIKPLKAGQQLLISCNSGYWSEVYGLQGGSEMVAAPAEFVCAAGYVVQISIKPSKRFATTPVDSTYAGSVAITCSDGSVYTLDAQPTLRTRVTGTVLQAAGFTTIVQSVSRIALDSLFGVGGNVTNATTFNCPSNTVVTGIAGGAALKKYPKSWIRGLQWRCSNPFGDDAAGRDKLLELMQGSYAKVPSGAACKSFTAVKGDTWQSVALHNSVLVTELIRSNSWEGAEITPGTEMVIPPCRNVPQMS